MGVAVDIKVAQNIQGSLACVGCYLFGGGIAPHDLSYFNVHQSGRMKGVGSQDSGSDGIRSGQSEQPLDYGRGVEDDQRASRSARVAF